MPIKENPSLIHCERTIYDYLNNFNIAEQTLNPNLPETPLFVHTFDQTANNAEDCEILCLFYIKLIRLITKSLEIKRGICQKKTIGLDKKNEELDKIKIGVTQYTEALRVEYPEHWSFLLTRPIGRLSIYYLVNISLINNLWGNSLIVQMWLIELHRTSSSIEEKNVLEHLKALAIESYEPQTVIISEELLVTNPYLFFQQTIIKVESKEKMTEIMQKPLVFFRELPVFTINFIKLNFSYKIIQKLFTLEFTPDEILSLFEKTNLESFFPQKEIDKIQTSQDILQLIYYTINHMRIYARLYCLSLDKQLIYKERHPDLIFIHLNLFKKIQQNGYIHPDTMCMLAESCAELISTNLCSIWTNYASNERQFWEIASIIFNFQGLIKPEFVELLSNHINSLIDKLTSFGFVHEAREILVSYIELNDIHQSLTPANKKNYLLIVEILKFCTLLLPLINELESAETEKTSFIKEFLNTTQHIKIDISTLKPSHFKKNWPHFTDFLISFLLQHLKALNPFLNLKTFNSSDLENLHKLQTLSHHILNITEATSKQKELIPAYLKDNELYEIRIKALVEEFDTVKKTKSKTKTSPEKAKKAAPETAAASLTSHSLFTPALQEPQYISTKEIPECLLKLAMQIKTQFNINLILCGGAVTNLFLRRPNPNDYDCVVFNLNLTELCHFLSTAGYTNVLIVGKHYPILKIKIIANEKVYEIDLTTVNVAPHRGLDVCMQDILKNRDFKISSLFIDLIPTSSHFEIKGFDHAIHSVNLKKIAVVQNPKRKAGETIFSEDPLRAFRFIKILLQYPDFSPDSHLQHILKITPFKSIFTHFLLDDLNQSRISTAIEALFKRFSFLEVIDKLGTYGIIEGLTGFSFKEIQSFVSHLNIYTLGKIQQQLETFEKTGLYLSPETRENQIAYTKKFSFFQFLFILHCIKHPDTSPESWKTFGLLRKVKISDQFYTYIQDAIKNRSSQTLIEPNLIKFLENIIEEYAMESPSDKLSLSA